MVDCRYAELFKDNSVNKQLNIEFEGGVITNEDLHSENFELEETLCSDNRLRFGACEAAVVKFRVSNIVAPLKDKWLNITETLGGNTDVSFSLGKYKVNSDKPTADRKYRDVTAYDAMYDILNADVTEWYNKVLPTAESAVTLKEFRNSFFEHLRIEQEVVTLVNDDLVIERTVDPSKLSGKQVITAICEVNGCFGHIGRNGVFRYVFLKEMTEGLYPADTLYPQDDLYPEDPTNAEHISKSHYISAEYEDFVVAKIDKLQIRTEEDDIGYICGDGDNCYVIQDNFLVYGKSEEELQTVASNIYSLICDIWYRPAHVEAIGNLCLEVGDGIRLSTKYEIIYSYILQRRLKGIQALRDTYDAEGEEYQSEEVNSIRESIVQLKGKTSKLTRTVEETKLELSDLEQNAYSQIQANAQQISLKVSKDNLISEINQTAESVTIKAEKIDLEGLVNADELMTKYATTTDLDVLGNLVAQKANISDLTAVNLKVEGKLDATEFTADNISGMGITVNSANIEGTLSAEQVDVAGLVESSGFKGKSITVMGVTATTGVNTQYINNQPVSWKTITVLTGAGTTETITYLGN